MIGWVFFQVLLKFYLIIWFRKSIVNALTHMKTLNKNFPIRNTGNCLKLYWHSLLCWNHHSSKVYPIFKVYLCSIYPQKSQISTFASIDRPSPLSLVPTLTQISHPHHPPPLSLIPLFIFLSDIFLFVFSERWLWSSKVWLSHVIIQVEDMFHITFTYV